MLVYVKCLEKCLAHDKDCKNVVLFIVIIISIIGIIIPFYR